MYAAQSPNLFNPTENWNELEPGASSPSQHQRLSLLMVSQQNELKFTQMHPDI